MTPLDVVCSQSIIRLISNRTFKSPEWIPAVWRHELLDFARGLVQLVFPNTCLICEEAESDLGRFRHGLCSDCHRAVSTDSRQYCPRCGLTVGPHSDVADGCAGCRNESLGFEAVIRLGPYETRLREAVIRMKSESGTILAEMMGRVFFEAAGDRLRAARSDCVVPVPLHWRREWHRGHNQSTAIGEGLASGLGIALDRKCLRRVRHTPQQLQPSATARRENVRGAFRIRRGSNLDGKRILLVDDVMTTGSTAGEAARTLRQAGAKAVIVAILARR